MSTRKSTRRRKKETAPRDAQPSQTKRFASYVHESQNVYRVPGNTSVSEVTGGKNIFETTSLQCACLATHRQGSPLTFTRPRRGHRGGEGCRWLRRESVQNRYQTEAGKLIRFRSSPLAPFSRRSRSSLSTSFMSLSLHRLVSQSAHRHGLSWPGESKNTACPGCGSARGRGHVAHGRNPAHDHSPGRGHDVRPVRGHGAHLCAESSRGRRGEGRETGRAGGIDEDGGRGRDQSRSATTQKEGCGPTTTLSAEAQSNTNMNILPRSSACRRGPSACCASHGRHRRRRDGPRTPQKRTYVG